MVHKNTEFIMYFGTLIECSDAFFLSPNVNASKRIEKNDFGEK